LDPRNTQKGKSAEKASRKHKISVFFVDIQELNNVLRLRLINMFYIKHIPKRLRAFR